MRPLNLMRFLFSPFGRYARLPFFGTLAWCAGMSMLTMTATAAEGGFDNADFEPTPLGVIFLLLAGALILWPAAAGMSKRLHDLNLSAWLMLPAFIVPVIAVAQWIAMQFPVYDDAWDAAFTKAYGYALVIWPPYLLGLLTLLCVFPGRRHEHP